MAGLPQDRVAMVTGAARGIGRACAWKLATQGADVVLNDRESDEDLTSLAAQIEALGRKVLVCLADVSDSSAVRSMFEQVDQSFGRLDILVNNAAWNVRKPFLELSLDEARKTMDATFWGAFHSTQQAVKHMMEHGGGSVVMISSVHAVRPYPNASAYNAAKAALHHLAASLALELAPHRIRVNTVEPGWIDTPGERLHNTEPKSKNVSSFYPWHDSAARMRLRMQSRIFAPKLRTM